MGSSYQGLRRVASFRPYTSKQVGDTGPAESARRRNLHALGSSFSGARETDCMTSNLANFLKIIGNLAYHYIKNALNLMLRKKNFHPYIKDGLKFSCTIKILVVM